MSVCFFLYKIYDIKDSLSDIPYPVCLNEYGSYNFTDGKSHELIDLTYNHILCKRLDKFKSVHKFIETITKGHLPRTYYYSLEDFEYGEVRFYKEKPSRKFNRGKYLCADIEVYKQGWYLKPRFFKKKFPFYYCSTKNNMEKFLDRYLDYRRPEAVECKKAFMDAWKDGMLFSCRW